jgi:hypothetical protein
MIAIENLTNIQKSLCDILWELDDPAELAAFLTGLPQRLRQDAEAMMEMMLLASIDQTQDTKLADEMINKILNKPGRAQGDCE